MTPEQRLARIKEFVTSHERLEAWDTWRAYISGGGVASWPRDAFEAMLDRIADECEEDSSSNHLPPRTPGR